MGVRRDDLPRAFHIAEGMARDAEAADSLLRRADTGLTKREAIAIRLHWRSRQKVRSPRPPHTRVGRARVYREAATSWGGWSISAACCNCCGLSWRRGCVRPVCVPGTPDLSHGRGRGGDRDHGGRCARRRRSERWVGRRAAPDGAGAVVPRRVRPRGRAGALTHPARPGRSRRAAWPLPATMLHIYPMDHFEARRVKSTLDPTVSAATRSRSGGSTPCRHLTAPRA